MYQRDGIGREVLINEHGAGHFLAEVGQLSGRPALVNGMAIGSVEALLIPPESHYLRSRPQDDRGSRSY